MKKKIICMFIIITIIIVYSIRVAYVNRTAIKTIPLQYTMGVEVPIEDDYFDDASENMRGYTVTVVDTELLTMNEYRQRYGGIDDFLRERGEYDETMYYEYPYMYLVHVTFENESNEFGNAAGINLTQYILQDKSYITYLERDAYKQLNGLETLSFALRLNSEKDFIIPFGINTDYIDVNEIENGSPELVISLYPHKKSIVLR